jgi:alpha-L-rhamnosidase
MLESGQRVAWQVQVWTDAGESEWSEPAWWEMGLLAPTAWAAEWIEPTETDEVRAQSVHPPYLLCRSFSVDAPVARARLYVTAHGIYEFFINGGRVGDMELTPGFTSYWSNLQVQTFDVTDLIAPGENIAGAIVSDGWFRGQTNGFRLDRVFGDTVALLAQLEVQAADGTVTRIGTGPGWLSATGSIRAADLIEGQVVDFRREPRGWRRSGVALEGWAPVSVRDYDMGRLTASPAPPVRRVQQLRPIRLTRLDRDRQVVDLGQNISGWVKLGNLGPAGTSLTLTHGEALDREGDVTLAHLAEPGERPGLEYPNLRSPFQVDRVISAGIASDCFEPRHTTHGFRYVRIEGHPDDLTVDDVTGVVVHTDLRRTGWFECSDERINRLHEAAVWSFRTNACDIPTDCPTRERAGWTGDWQIFAATAAFLYDVAGFSTKWLRDLATEQQANGAVLNFIPSGLPADSLNNPLPAGSAGWGDAAVIVPWEIYRAYGDRRLLEEQWESMIALVEYAARAARDFRHPSRISARPIPAEHEAFLWDTGFHWGEWAEPGELEDFDGNIDSFIAKLGAVDNGILATAYLHHSSHILAQIASVLGRIGDAGRLTELAALSKAAWQAEFIRPDGTLTSDSQASHVRALAFDLVPDELRPQMAQRLVELVRAAGTHLGTGFLATQYLLPVLADNGRLDVAYELLFQDTEPSWLTMIDRGATTIWEVWNGINQDGVPSGSLNHYSKGAVVSFLHRYVGGIQLLDDTPAYRRFRIKPMPGGGITSATATHDSPYGRIESSWHVDDDQFTLDVTVPPGTVAEICLPDGRCLEAQPGSVTYRATNRDALITIP